MLNLNQRKINMARINAAEILAEKYPKIFGKKAPIERAVAVLDYRYIGSGETTLTKSDLTEGIRTNGEILLERLDDILASSEFQDLAVLLVIAEEAGLNDSPQAVKVKKKINFIADELTRPNVVRILKNDLREVGPRRFGRRAPIFPISNFDPELDMPPTIEEARWRSSNWQSPW